MASRLRQMSAMVHGPNYKWWALLSVAIGVLMATFDSGMVAVSLPTIMGYLQADIATVQWVVLAFLLTITITLLVFGRLADMVGRRRIYSLGVVIFAVGSALCGAAASAEQLIAFRVLQALGASMLMANAMAITGAVFPPAERGMALGVVGTVVATGITLGPSVGGALTQWLGWRAVFYVNVPMGVIGAAMAFLILRDEAITPTLAGRRPRFDLAGALIAGFGLLALMMAISGGRQMGLPAGASTALYAVAGAAFVAFLLVERRVKEPLIDLGLFRRPLFALGSASGLLSFLALSANMFLLPFYLQLILGFSPAQAGLLMIPGSLTIAAISPLSGWLSDRMGARSLSSAGLLLVSLSLVALSQLDATSGYGDVLLRLVVLGVGQGLFQSPNNSSVLGSVPRERYGVAGGFLSMMRNLGQVVGAALASNILIASLAEKAGHANLDVLRTAGASGDPLLLSGFLSGMEEAYVLAAILAAVGIITSLGRGGSFRRNSAPVMGSDLPLSSPSDIQFPSHSSSTPSKASPSQSRTTRRGS